MDREVTPFLVEKWTRSFHLLDVDKDGVLTSDDYAAIADYISKKTGSTEEEAAKTRQEWVKWSYLVQPDPSKKLDLEAFINGGKELFKDLVKLRADNRTWASDMFDRMDLNSDGKISLEELTVFYEAMGLNNKALIANTFKAIDKDGDGYIQREELIEDIVCYFTDPEPVQGKAYLFFL